MSFYSAISDHYDAIFPADAAEMAFVSKLLEGRRKILDIGCGTGNKTVLFKKGGNEITAVDADEGMIERARKDHAEPGVNYKVLDMLHLGEAFPAGSFDAALCLGNTLAHLPGPDAVSRALRDVAALLEVGGRIVIQILNYDRILARNVTALPVLETGEFRFSRFYEWEGDTMYFVTELALKKSGETLKNAVPLYPLRKAELDACFTEAGFGAVDYFGSYGGDPLTDDCFVLIAAAGK